MSRNKIVQLYYNFILVSMGMLLEREVEVPQEEKRFRQAELVI